LAPHTTSILLGLAEFQLTNTCERGGPTVHSQLRVDVFEVRARRSWRVRIRRRGPKELRVDLEAVQLSARDEVRQLVRGEVAYAPTQPWGMRSSEGIGVVAVTPTANLNTTNAGTQISHDPRPPEAGGQQRQSEKGTDDRVRFRKLDLPANQRDRCG
jgi:hypothetical protein